MVGLHVRVPDAFARDARAGRQPPRADQPPGGAPPARARRGARRAMGNFRIRLQRARPRAHLPVFQLRRARAGAEARPERERGHRAVRDRACGDGRPGGGGAQLRAPRGARRARALRLLRGARLHPGAPAGGTGSRPGARLHGAPPGHDHRRPRQRAPRRPDAGTVSRRADGAGHRAPAAGAHAARCRARASARRGSRHGGGGAQPRAAPTR
jgi:hypothetical protein